MLEAVGHPSAVNPDRALRKEAVAREWPVLVFARPVRLRDRFAGVSLPHPSTLAAVAVSAGAATAVSCGSRPGAEAWPGSGCRVSGGRHAVRPCGAE
jgi:hypothetical protein